MIQSPTRSALRFLVWTAAAAGVFGGALLAHTSEQAFGWVIQRWPALGLAQRLPSFYEPHKVFFTLIAIVLSLIATALLRLLSKGGPQRGQEEEPAPEGGPPVPDLPLTVTEKAAVALCLLATFAFLLSLRTGSRGGPVVVFWVAVQVLALGAALLIDLRRGRRWPRLALGEIVFLGLLCAVTSIAYSRDLNSYLFASLGDEWEVYDAAASVANQPPEPRSVFAGVEEGVYAVHPPFLTFVQSNVMRVAGVDNFGWRLSGVLALSLTLPCFYVFARLFLGRLGAGLATLLTAVSYYLIAEAHTGYGWGLPRLFTWAALAGFAVLIRRPSLTAAVAVGILCGYSSLIDAMASLTPFLVLAAIPFVLSGRPTPGGRLRLLCRPSRRTALTFWGVAGLAFLLTSVVPRAAFRNPDVRLSGVRRVLWKTNVGPLLTHYFGPNWTSPPLERSYTPGEFVASTRDNLLRTLLAPLSYSGSSHYVHGPVLDPVTAGLTILGILVSVSSRRQRRRTSLLWVFFIAFLMVTGVLSPAFEYSDLRITRMHFLVPFWTLFAGIGFVALAEGLSAVSTWWTPRVVPGLAVGLGIGAALLNFHAFYVRERGHEPDSPSAWVVKVMAESPSTTELYMCFFEGWAPAGVEHYPGHERLHRVTTEEFVLAGGRPAFSEGARLLFPNCAETPGCRKVLDWFVSSYPDVRLTTIRDSLERTKILSCSVPTRPPPVSENRQPERGVLSVGPERMFFSPCSAEVPSGENPVKVLGKVTSDFWALPPGVSRLVLVPQGAQTFSAQLALAEVPDLSPETEVEFTVEVDGRPVERNILVRAQEPPVALRLSLSNARVLVLKARWLAGSPPDRVLPVWLSPRFSTFVP